MKVLDLFSGIGGFALGLERAGMQVISFCEKDKNARKILKKHWPTIPIYDDIRKITKESYNETTDVICGGFPCQPYSRFGLRTGAADDRALWPEMFRVIENVKPKWVVAENVIGFIDFKLGFEKTVFDLESKNYEVQSFIIPACAIGAPHRRDRIWIIATRRDVRSFQDRKGLPPKMGRVNFFNSGEGDISRLTQKTKRRVRRLTQLGNAVVPQVVEVIGRAIMEAEK